MPIHTEINGPVARILIDSPPMNQIDAQTHAALGAALDQAARDPAVRVLVLTGAGQQAFCAGADIAGLVGDRTPPEVDAFCAAWDELYRKVREFPHPTVAAVNGYALGGGFELLLNTDIRIAASHAKMGATAANLGLVTSIHSLAAHLPLPLAKELFYTARHLTASDALQMGLVNWVVAPDELEAATQEIVGQIIRRAPLSLQAAKTLFHLAPQMSRSAHDDLHRQAFVELSQTADHREGVRAFLERRRANFRGE